MMDCSVLTSQGIFITVLCSAIAGLGFYAFVKFLRDRKKKIAKEIQE